MSKKNTVIRASYLPEDERLHVQRFTRDVFLLDEHEASEDYYGIYNAALYILQFAFKEWNVKSHIYFAIQDKNDKLFSSMSVPYRDYYVIIIGSQPFYHLISFCERLAALPPFCLAIDKEEITTSMDYTNDYLLNIIQRLSCEYEGVKHVLQRSPIDLTMTNATLAYIIGHEIAHAAHGHLSFKSSKKFNDFFSDDDDKALTRRTFERDADIAGTNLVMILFENPMLRKHLAVFEIDHKNKRALEINRYKYIAGIFAAHLYGDAKIDNSNSNSYPSPYARFLISKNVLQQGFKNFSRDNSLEQLPNDVRMVLAKTFIQMSGNVQVLQHPFVYNITLVNKQNDTDKFYIYHALGEKEALDELIPLKRRWARIRPHLKNIRTGGKLPPVEAAPA